MLIFLDVCRKVWPAFRNVDCNPLLTGICALLHFTVRIMMLSDWTAGVYNSIPLTYFLTAISQRTSVFYSLILALIRTINILSPFYTINKRAVTIAVVIYPVIWVPTLIVEILHFYARPTMVEMVRHLIILPCVGKGILERIVQPSESNYGDIVELYITFTIPYVIPALISLVCMCIQARELLKTRNVMSSGGDQIGQQQRTMTGTILRLTLLYFVCNTCFTVILSVFYGFHIENEQVHDWIYITNIVAPFINSAFNPVILLTRSSELKRFMKGFVSKSRPSGNKLLTEVELIESPRSNS